MQGYVLLKKSQMAYDLREAHRVVTFAEAAQHGRWQFPRKVRRGHAAASLRRSDVGRKKSQMAYDLREAHRVVTFAEAAQHGRWQFPRKVRRGHPAASLRPGHDRREPEQGRAEDGPGPHPAHQQLTR